VRPARLALLLLLSSAPAPAFDEGVEAGLTIDRTHIDLDTGAELRITGATLFLTEELRPGFKLGLHGGALLLSQSGNAEAAGLEPTGFRLGVSAHGELFPQHRFGLAGTLSYSYLRAEDSDADRDLTIALHLARAELAGQLRLNGSRLQLGAYALHIDGDETLAGTPNRSRPLAADRGTGGFIQADLWVDPTGRVSLRLDGGARQAAALSFARLF